MKTSAVLDTRNFDAYVSQLAGRMGLSIARVQRMEAAAVVKRAALIQTKRIARIGAVREQTITTRVKRMVDGDQTMTVNLRRERGRVWYSDGRPGRDMTRVPQRWFPVGHLRSFKSGPSIVFDGPWRLPAQVWAAMKAMWAGQKAAIKKAVVDALASRGLMIRSWIEVIIALGANPLLLPPKGARLPGANALTRSGRPPPKNGYASERRLRGRSVIDILNTSPIAYLQDGPSIFAAALSIRAAAFQRALKAGAFRTAQGRARLYGFLVADR